MRNGSLIRMWNKNFILRFPGIFNPKMTDGAERGEVAQTLRKNPGIGAMVHL